MDGCGLVLMCQRRIIIPTTFYKSAPELFDTVHYVFCGTLLMADTLSRIRCAAFGAPRFRLARFTCAPIQQDQPHAPTAAVLSESPHEPRQSHFQAAQFER